jgi:hypothetical protein
MKRLIVVIISVLFLSVFLMMNYLIWDKDNLLKQQVSDKAQQDWLRGQNKDMEANIAELEQAVATLEKDKATLNEQDNSLQRQIRAATDREVSLRRTLDESILSVEALKTSSLPILKELLAGWMTAVSEGRSADSFLFFTQNYQFLQLVMTQETYQKYIETNIQAVAYTSSGLASHLTEAAIGAEITTDAAIGAEIATDAAIGAEVTTDAAMGTEVKTGDAKTGDVKTNDVKTGDTKPGDNNTGDDKTGEIKPGDAITEPVKETPAPEPVILFERVGNESSDLAVLVRTQVYVALKPDADTGTVALVEGLNNVQVLFSYDVINRKWYIQSIIGNN